MQMVDITRRTYLSTVTSATVGACGTLAGCLGGDDEDGITKATTNAGSTALLSQVLVDQGFLEEQNLTTEEFASPPQAQQQLVLNDDIDAGYMGSIVATRLADDGHDIDLVGPYQNYHLSLVTRADSDISEPEDLAGKRLNWAAWESDAWLKLAVVLNHEYGLDPYEFDFHETAPATSIGLMLDGDLDAILLHESMLVQVLADDSNDFEILLDPEDVWRESTGLPLTTTDIACDGTWFQENESAGEEFARACKETQEYILENTDEVVEQYHGSLGLESDAEIKLAKERVQNIYPSTWSDDLVESSLTIAEKAYELGLIESEPTEDIYNIINV